jgi:hypothetical protein
MRDFLRQSIGEGRLPEETWGLLDTALGVPTAEAVKAPAPTTDNILGTNDIVAP